MLSVSKEYQESMKKALRNRGYMRVNFYLRDTQTESDAMLYSRDRAYFSDDDIFDLINHGNSYITFEEHFCTVDGGMKVLPPKEKIRSHDARYKLTDSSFVSEDLFDREYQIEIGFRGSKIDVQGLRIDFGDNYPTLFSIANDSEIIHSFKNNERVFTTDKIFYNSRKLILKVLTMPYQNRVRIYSIGFVYKSVIDNSDIIDSDLDWSYSPIGEQLPQINFMVKILNSTEKFARFREIFNNDGLVEIEYGYEIDENNVEWVKGGCVYNEGYELGENEVTIRGRDILQAIGDVTYENETSGKSAFEVMADVFDILDITDYIIDPSLNNIYLSKSVSGLSCKEVLQITANFCQCDLYFSRSGKIIAERVKADEFVRTSTNIYYSEYKNIVNDTQKDEYIDFSQHYVPVDGSMKVLSPFSMRGRYESGYVSERQSNENGDFEVAPFLEISLGEKKTINEVVFEFGSAHPTFLSLKGYRGNELVKSENCYCNGRIFKVISEFDNITTIRVDFSKTEYPHNRIVLNNIRLLSIADFVIEKNDMLSLPMAEKVKTKDIEVAYGEEKERYTLNLSTEGESIIWENPMVADVNEAKRLAEWLKNYFDDKVTYQYTIRGNPEIEIRDRIHQINEENEKIDVLVTDVSLSFDGAFREEIGVKLELWDGSRRKSTGTGNETTTNITQVIILK